jgi:hypothetical protein
MTGFPSRTHKILEPGENTATVNWIAKDTISTTGRKITNDVDTALAFKGSLVIDHRDSFRYCLPAWTPGRLDAWTPGRLDAWTPIIKSKVRATTRKNFDEFRATSS